MGAHGCFDFTQYKKTLDWAGLLPNNTQTALVHDLKTDLVIMVYCNSSDYDPLPGSHWGWVMSSSK